MSERKQHHTDGLWGRQIREQAMAAKDRTKYKSHGSWGGWVRVKRRNESVEGDAICFIGNEYDYIAVLWDDANTPELVPASKLLHYGYWHKRKDWYPFEDQPQ